MTSKLDLNKWKTQHLFDVVANRISYKYALTLNRKELIEAVHNILKLEKSGHRQKVYRYA